MIGLHREPEAVPAVQRGVGEHGCDHLEREFEPVSLLGIHGEIEVEIARLARKLERPRHQFGQDTMARHRLELRMQGRELDRNAGTVRDIDGARGDGIDGMGIGGEIALRVGCRARALTQHVEGIAQRARWSASSIVCPSTKCEPRSRIPCRVAARTAGIPRRLMRLSRIESGVSPGWMMRAVTPSVQAEAETSSALDLTWCEDQSPVASLSSISRSAVAASGTRSNASANTMRASPSLVDSE